MRNFKVKTITRALRGITNTSSYNIDFYLRTEITNTTAYLLPNQHLPMYKTFKNVITNTNTYLLLNGHVKL